MFDVLCVGILVADAIAKPVTGLPEKGKLDLVDSIGLYTGGCAASASINIAKIGKKVAILGKIGDDGFGMFMKSSLENHGVETSGLIVSQTDGTSASLVIVNPDGERSFLHSLGANAGFCEKDIDYSVVKRSKLVFVAGSMLMPAFDGRDCALFLKKCKEMGIVTALDTAWDSKGRWMETLRHAMPRLDYFLPSYEEAVALSGERDADRIADCFLKMGPHTVVIKLGERGCFAKSARSGERFFVPAFEGIEVIDTTGAGDAFCSGFLSAVSSGKSLYDAALFANATGAHCVMAKGASTGIKSEEEIMGFIENHGG